LVELAKRQDAAWALQYPGMAGGSGCWTSPSPTLRQLCRLVDNDSMNTPITRRPFLGQLAGTAALLALPNLALRAQPAGRDDPALLQAVAASHRSEANRARDRYRHPYETLRFFGLQTRSQVVELTPGGGWYTEILAPYLRPEGRLYTASYAKDSASEGQRRARANFEARLAKQPEIYDRVFSGTLPSGGRFGDIAEAVKAAAGQSAASSAAGGVDLIVTFRNVHNWLEDGSLDDTLKACHALLRPGGVLGVEDHRAKPGTPIDAQNQTGYVAEALMEARAGAAGFKLEARSEVNANRLDTKDHPDGVWSLPPTYQGKDVGRERFAAIGESDRFTHRYVKG
jgi:predicted methyltransferase